MGRPSSFTPELAEAICEAIAGADIGLDKLCKQRDGFPSPQTIYRWLDYGEGEAFDRFRSDYARARKAQAERMAYDVLSIADDGSGDWTTNERGDPVLNHEHVQRSKLRVDARKWAAAHLAPKIWGERVAHEVSGPDGGPLRSSLSVEYVDSDDSGSDDAA